jgi:hypothetical protein
MQTTVKQTKNPMLHDQSLWFLIFANLITIVFAVAQGWSVVAVMWIYLFQSLIIGFFSFIRILLMKEYYSSPYKISGAQIIILEPSTMQKSKTSTAFFFVFHYGFFHFCYAFFLFTMTVNNPYDNSASDINFLYIGISVLIFFINHLFSFVYNSKREEEEQNINKLMALPYLRIIPMHLTIIFGFAISTLALPFFLLLKTGADVIMHVSEHKKLRS